MWGLRGIGGGLIRLLLVVAVIVSIFNLFNGSRSASKREAEHE
ncbi:MAG TPA: DUF5670 family protein [Blastocatellia bacterium]|nr:DUF5670 family protein [Blastocatellia bacterium]